MSHKPVRTRFAPSPTGYLHVGGARTALFCWLYARHFNGQFILRIEDTDRERSTEEAVQAILDGMEWLGLTPDEGPFYQTKRFNRYKEVIQQLLASGHAYRCYCSKERLDKLREEQTAQKIKPKYDGHCRHLKEKRAEPYVIRFKNPQEGDVIFNDLVLGEIKISNEELDDLILARSDGDPTYNLTVVVDDFDMNISHVIRGADHINNTPRQINIFKALNIEPPIYGHVPMILGSDGKKLSKRHGAVSVMQYCYDGILPDALNNYLLRLGWSHGDQEIFSRDEMIQFFDGSNLNKSAAMFNQEKLLWLNQHYQKTLDPDYVAPAFIDQLNAMDIDVSGGPDVNEVIKLQAERTKDLKEMAERSAYFYQDVSQYDEAAARKNLQHDMAPPLQKFADKLTALSQWQKELIHEAIIATAEESGLALGKLAQPVRVAVTGGTVSPPLDATLLLIGRDRVLARLKKAIQYAKAQVA